MSIGCFDASSFSSLKGSQHSYLGHLCAADIRTHSCFLACALVYEDQTSIRVAGGAGPASHLHRWPYAGPQDTTPPMQPAKQDRGRHCPSLEFIPYKPLD